MAGARRAAAPGSLHVQLASLWLLALGWVQHTLAAPPQYEPKLWNRSCNYTVSGVPPAVFFNRTGSNDDALFPISPGYRIPRQEGDGSVLAVVQLSCFGPGQRVNQTLVAAGLKMPCGYKVSADGRVDYWEEAACGLSLQSNCYCYSLNAQSSSGYCIPGYNTAGTINVDFSVASGDPCADAVRKVQLDGGRLVTRQEVYEAQQPQRGHFIALVVWPDNDFHFMRRDAAGWWSQKRGDTFVTNTYPNGSVVLDAEDPAILGVYRQFCGYFHVDPSTHARTDSNWTYSSVPERLVAVQEHGYAVSSTPLPQPSTGWTRLNYPYLLFGLDAAVFESAGRRLPWQLGPAVVGAESGQKDAQPTAAHSSSGSSSGSNSGLQPHWTSHAQHTTTTQQRDRAVRAHYTSAVASLQGLQHVQQ